MAPSQLMISTSQIHWAGEQGNLIGVCHGVHLGGTMPRETVHSERWYTEG